MGMHAKGALAALGVALAAATPAGADAPGAQGDLGLAQEDRIAELERTVRVLAEELERTRTELAVPEEAELASQFGRGPAAAKIYAAARGLSIGGYGEARYSKLVDDSGSEKDRADLLRSVLYVGYKFTDRILVNTEIEFEHATTGSTESSGGGSVSVEFAHLDFLWREWANARAGLVLVPMGFINEIHEPPFFFGVDRPELEQRIIPTTWRENGVGLFGALGESVEYEAYVLDGFNAEGFDSGGLRGGRQKGNRALAEHLAFVGKLRWSPTPAWLLGGSVYHGNSGQNQTVTVSAMGGGSYPVGIPDTPTTIWELHSQYESQGLHLRALVAMSHLGDTGQLTAALGPVGTLAVPGGTGALAAGEAVASDMLGFYGEVAYDVLRWLAPRSEKTLEPFFRFEWVDTQLDVPGGSSKDGSDRMQLYTVGFSFKPIPRVVIKADYRNRVADEGSLSDALNLGVGFAF